MSVQAVHRIEPVDYPWINRIERLWKAMHDTVTRNHHCETLYQLCQDVKCFFQFVQPFPGAGHDVARFGSLFRRVLAKLPSWL